MNRPLALKRALRVILFLIPVAVLGNIAYTAITSGNSGFQALFDMSLFWLAAALFLSLAPWLVAMLRLYVWSRFFKLHLRARDLFEIVLANDVAAAATPTAVGGGYAKIGFLVYHGARPGLAASLMVIGSLEDYLIIAILVPLGWAFYPPEGMNILAIIGQLLPSSSGLAAGSGAALVLLAGVIGLMKAVPGLKQFIYRLFRASWWQVKLIRPIAKMIQDFQHGFVLISQGGKLLFAVNTLLAGVQWIMRYSIFTAIAHGFGLDPHPVEFFLLQWLIFALMNFMPTPGAIGGAELAFTLVFKHAVPPELLSVASGAWRFITTYLQIMIAAALLALLERPSFKKQAASEHPDATSSAASDPLTAIANQPLRPLRADLMQVKVITSADFAALPVFDGARNTPAPAEDEQPEP